MANKTRNEPNWSPRADLNDPAELGGRVTRNLVTRGYAWWSTTEPELGMEL